MSEELQDDILQDEKPKKKKMPLPQRVAIGIGGLVGLTMLILTLTGGEEDAFSPQSNVAPSATVGETVAGGQKDERFQELEEDFNRQRVEEAKSQGLSTIDTLPELELLSVNSLPERPPEEVAVESKPLPRYTPPQNNRDSAAQALERESEAEAQRRADRIQAKLTAMQDLKAGRVLASHSNEEVLGYEPIEEVSPGTDGTADNEAGTEENEGNPIPVGTLMYASLDTPINSDEPSPVRATILSGALEGAVLVGGYDRVDEKVLISFDSLSFQGNSTSINAVAIDPDTSRTAIASHVERRTLSRWSGVIATALLAGYQDSVRGNNTTITVNGTSTTSTQEEFSTGEQAKIALGEVGERTSPLAEEYFNRPPTVYVTNEEHPAIGIMFVGETREEWLPLGIK